MKKNVLEFWVGLFVLAGIAALAFLSFRAASGNSLFAEQREEYTVHADFSDIGSVKIKSPVKIAGVVIGRVSDIRLDPKTLRAQASLTLDKRYPLTSDVSAQVITSGLLGEQYIGLTQGGDPEYLADGDTITLTSSAFVLENLIGTFMTSFAEKNAAPSEQAASAAP